jgi:hypothetical protein
MKRIRIKVNIQLINKKTRQDHTKTATSKKGSIKIKHTLIVTTGIDWYLDAVTNVRYLDSGTCTWLLLPLFLLKTCDATTAFGTVIVVSDTRLLLVVPPLWWNAEQHCRRPSNTCCCTSPATDRDVYEYII